MAPPLRAVMERRILVNYRVDPDVLAAVLPAPFRPLVVAGHGVELGTDGWDLRPLHIDEACSSFFDDPSRFPRGSIELDSAFLMGGMDTTWRPQAALHAPSPRQPVAP